MNENTFRVCGIVRKTKPLEFSQLGGFRSFRPSGNNQDVLAHKQGQHNAQDRLAVSTSQCVKNLLLISSAKANWALELKKTNGAAVSWREVLPFVEPESKDQLQHCPDGGEYSLGKIGEQPRCSIGGTHTLLN